MKRSFAIVSCLILLAVSLQAQESGQLDEYRRNSLATILVYHPEDEFGINIYEAFDSLPLPDKYDDHNIAGYRIIDNSDVYGVLPKDSGLYKARYGHVLSNIEMRKNAKYFEDLLNKTQMPKLMIAKWFGLTSTNPKEGYFNTDLIQTRGQYNASDVEVEKAMLSVRGIAALADAGEELIGQTFVLVNDITYVTAEEEAAAAKVSLAILGGIFDALFGGSAGRNVANLAGAAADKFTGFNVKTHSYLYRLDWNDTVATIFYQNYYTSTPNPQKLQAFLNNDSLFHLRFVAHEYEYDKKSTLKGKYERSELVKTICARSMDKNIVALGKQYEDFKVKTPIYSVLRNENGRIQGYTAKIGMKEGITEKSSFQVVQRIYNPETQRTTYRYVATIKPIKKQIWDNRFNAVLEQDKGSELEYTTFKKTGGGEILPGMLIIEGKYSKVKE